MTEHSHHTDLQLVEQARNGDHQAFKMLVTRYRQRVATTVIGMLGYCTEAEDVGQETFVRFYRALHNFRGDAAVGTYLTRIAINLSLNELKKRKKRPVFSLLSKPYNANSYNNNNDDEYELPIADANETPEKYEARELVQKALQQLEPKFRSVVLLRLVEGYSTQETADLLHIPLGTVLSRLARAQEKLKELLTKLQR
ncbi:RNA polymerase subunit sigma-24 [Sphingobacteriales bacterium UPWRP_1]|nr:hypothetical protein BVG80_15140 [Sphingobacteriales bacterium TSM_CSM]PSJ79084.1 RNA polymerase subunit sigma-24 [Sphingobacteriales bacterium UPWRP_1]